MKWFRQPTKLKITADLCHGQTSSMSYFLTSYIRKSSIQSTSYHSSLSTGKYYYTWIWNILYWTLKRTLKKAQCLLCVRMRVCIGVFMFWGAFEWSWFHDSNFIKITEHLIAKRTTHALSYSKSWQISLCFLPAVSTSIRYADKFIWWAF